MGICDRECRLAFHMCMWNGKDPILKERLFGLINSEVSYRNCAYVALRLIIAGASDRILYAVTFFNTFPHRLLLASTGKSRRGRERIVLLS